MADDIFDIVLLLDASQAMPGGASVIAMFREMLGVLADARKEAAKLGQETSNMRDSLRDVATLKGQAGVSDKLMAENLGLQKASGMTAQQAHEFQYKFTTETGPYAGKMDPKEYAKFQEKTAQFAQAVGGDVGARGELAGRILKASDKGMTAGQGLEQMNRINAILETGGGNTDAVTQQYNTLAAALVQPGGKGQTRDLESAAILSAGAARFDPKAVKTVVQAFGRAVQGQSGSAAWNKFATEKLGVTGDKKIEENMETVFKALEEQEQKGVNITGWLKEHGLAREGERRNVVSMFGARDLMRRQFAGDINTLKDTGEERIAKYQQDPAAQQRMAEAGLREAKMDYGKRQEQFNLYMKKAAVELFPQLSPEAKAAGWLEDTAARMIGTSREEVMLRDRAKQIFEREHKVRLGEDKKPGEEENAYSDFKDMQTAGGWLNPLSSGIAVAKMMKRAVRGPAAVAGSDLAGQMAQAEDARGLGGDRSRGTAIGPNNQAMTGGEFGSYLASKGVTGEQYQREMAKFLRRVNEHQGAPMMPPAPGNVRH